MVRRSRTDQPGSRWARARTGKRTGFPCSVQPPPAFRVACGVETTNPVYVPLPDERLRIVRLRREDGGVGEVAHDAVQFVALRRADGDAKGSALHARGKILVEGGEQGIVRAPPDEIRLMDCLRKTAGGGRARHLLAGGKSHAVGVLQGDRERSPAARRLLGKLVVTSAGELGFTQPAEVRVDAGLECRLRGLRLPQRRQHAGSEALAQTCRPRGFVRNPLRTTSNLRSGRRANASRGDQRGRKPNNDECTGRGHQGGNPPWEPPILRALLHVGNACGAPLAVILPRTVPHCRRPATLRVRPLYFVTVISSNGPAAPGT